MGTLSKGISSWSNNVTSSRPRILLKEQEEMCEKIIGILDLPETNTITLYELDNDKEKQKK